MRVIFADGGHAGYFVDRAAGWHGRVISVVKRTAARTFEVLPKRWLLERTFAWVGRYRRLSKDYETLPETSETMIRIAMIHLMLYRLSPG